MPAYTLTDYSDYKYDGNLVRVLLSQVDQQYKYVQIIKDDENAEMIQKYEGQLPVLTNQTYHVSGAFTIARYLGNLYDLYGANASEKAEIDFVLATFAQMITAFETQLLDPKAESLQPDWPKEDLEGVAFWRAFYLEKLLPSMFTIIQRRLEKNGGQFLAGCKLSIADITAQYYCHVLTKNDPGFAALLKNYPKLKAHVEKIGKMPKIAAGYA